MTPSAKFNKERSRYLHVSAPIISNTARQIEIVLKGSSTLPEFIVGPRTTFFKRRNEYKRMCVSTCASEGTKPFRLADPLVRCTHKETP